MAAICFLEIDKNLKTKFVHYLTKMDIHLTKMN